MAALPLLAACSSDDPIVNGGGGSGDDSSNEGVYMTVNINPNGRSGLSRSQTNGDDSSNDGTEVGSNDENKINSVLIVLANPATNAYIAHSVVETSDSKNTLVDMSVDGEKVYQAHAKFSKTDISSYYSTLSDEQERKVNVFIYCNPVGSLKTKFSSLTSMNTDWVNWSYSFSDAEGEGGLWVKPTDNTGGFMMTNVSMAPRFLPSNMDDWSFYSNESSPFDLSGVNNPGLLTEVDNSSDNEALKGKGGAIEVQRMAARFDFRDGSQMKGTNGNGAEGIPFTYNTILDSDEQPLVQTEIVNMSLVNLINSQYYLRRTSPTGADEDATLLGVEKKWTFNSNGTTTGTPGNFVVSRYADEKVKDDLGIHADFGNYFKYPFFNSTTNQVQDPEANGGAVNYWATSYVKKVCEGTPNDNYGANEYYVWRYVTENTIPAPGGNYNLQNNGQTTGIVFKAKMKSTDNLAKGDYWDQKLNTALTTKTGSDAFKADILYAYAGKKLYCTWEHVQNAALAAAGYNPNATEQNLDRSASLYAACFGTGGAGTVEYHYLENGTPKTITFTDNLDPDPNSANTAWVNWKAGGYPASGNLLNEFRKKVTGATFTIYQGSVDKEYGWGYYCYYYYWNHHNDNLNNTVLGPMEIATVRNNVYKLAVTRLNTLGHPRIPANDPDTPTPDTPDEKGDIYMQVNVKVVPWVVRINNIEF